LTTIRFVVVFGAGAAFSTVEVGAMEAAGAGAEASCAGGVVEADDAS
jgi:hypothetical protein